MGATQSRLLEGSSLLLGRFDRPAAPATTLAVLADPHVTPDGDGTWKCYHRTEDLLRRAVADVNASGADAVVVVGDLTADGRPREFERAAAVLDGLAVPALCVPGNHDVPKDYDDHSSPPLLAFVSRFTPGSLPFRERVGSVDLVGLNTASRPDGSLADTHTGGVGSAQLAWLDRTLAACDTPVVATHHPLAPGRDHCHRGMADDEHRVANADALCEVLARHDVALTLAGHVHWPTVGRLGARSWAVGHEVVAPAVCSFPQSYLLVRVDPRGTTVELVPLADPDETEAAYEAALADHDRSAALARTADDGYFERFPLVDARPEPLP